MRNKTEEYKMVLSTQFQSGEEVSSYQQTILWTPVGYPTIQLNFDTICQKYRQNPQAWVQSNKTPLLPLQTTSYKSRLSPVFLVNWL